MKNLEKVVKVWTNLESSYTGYKKSHKSVNRADYLKKLLAWDTNGANITGVRNLLHDEIDTYDAKEAATYSELFDELDKTAERLASYSGEIENLDEWVQGVMESDLAKDAVNAVVYTADDFTLLSNHTYAEARDILAAGYFCNTVVMDKMVRFVSTNLIMMINSIGFSIQRTTPLCFSGTTRRAIQSSWKV